MVSRASDVYLVLMANGGCRDCGISEGGTGDHDRYAYLHVRLPRCRGDCAERDDHDASLKRGHIVSNCCRHPHPHDLTGYIFDVAEVVMFTHPNQIAIPFP